MPTIHWFRRDLRLADNTALHAAAQSANLIPLFILDDALLSASRSSPARVAFMLDCLHALDASLRARGSGLVLRRGEPLVVLRQVIAETGANRLTYNRDYSPYARQRDQRVQTGLSIPIDTYADLVLHEFDEVLTDSGAPYQVFTPYKRRWLALPKPQPVPDRPLPPLPPQLERGEIPPAVALGAALPPQPITSAGEDAARTLLADFVAKRLATYATGRDMLGADGTSRLSAHLRWGTISIRQCNAAAQKLDGASAAVWLAELAWRDFYHMILAHYPHVLRRSFRAKYDRIAWENNADYFAAWCEGRTGYPIIDAAMHQLAATGWMHNRARMLVASFLCKDLLVDWRWGEHFFMQKLLDGDSAANNGGWQWAAGTGTDAAPYFRIFNPTTQGQKFDPNGDYIRRWLPGSYHVAPIVDHRAQRQKALDLYAVTKNDGASCGITFS